MHFQSKIVSKLVVISTFAVIALVWNQNRNVPLISLVKKIRSNAKAWINASTVLKNVLDLISNVQIHYLSYVRLENADRRVKIVRLLSNALLGSSNVKMILVYRRLTNAICISSHCAKQIRFDVQIKNVLMTTLNVQQESLVHLEESNVGMKLALLQSINALHIWLQLLDHAWTKEFDVLLMEVVEIQLKIAQLFRFALSLLLLNVRMVSVFLH